MALSKYFSGYVVTSSPVKHTGRIGRFAILARPARAKGFASFLCLLSLSLRALHNRRERIELIVTYDPLKTGLLGLVLRRWLDAPLIVEVNGVIESPAIYPIKDRVVKRRLYVQLARSVMGRADGVKFLFDAHRVRYQTDLEGRRCAVYPDFVDTARFTPGPDTSTILSIGHPFSVKGMDLLVRAFINVAEDFPDWRLVILGHHNVCEREELTCLAQHHPRVDILRAVDPEKIPARVKSSGILALCSRSEAMGRVLIEAMASSKPIVAARVDGIPSVVEDGVEGLLFAPEDVGDLTIKLRSLMTDCRLRESLGRAGLSTSRSRLSPQRYLAETKRFYSSVVSGAKQS